MAKGNAYFKVDNKFYDYSDIGKTKTEKKLTLNCLSEDMIQCAIEKGYKIPCVSISRHYGKKAIFTHNESGYSLDIIGNDGKSDYIYMMN